MSNGDDVLDNWDEIDEAGLNNTLHKIQADRKTTVSEQLLSKTPGTTSSSTAFNTAVTAAAVHQSATNNFQPMKLLQRTQSQENTHVSTLAPIKSIASNSSSALKSPLDDMSASFQPVMMVLHQPVDEYQSANYTAPISSQTVKILRRPTQSSEPRNNDMRPRQPIKTLQQREQEYAEARLRILGSAKNPEDDVANATSNNTGPASTTAPSANANANAKGNATLKTPIALNAYNNHQQTPQLPAANLYNNISNISYNNQRTALAANMQMHQPPQQQPQQTWSPIVGGMVSATTSQRLHQQESILRMPRGPDGSTGFQMRR